MNQKTDTSIALALKQKGQENYLYTNGEWEKIIIENGEIKNNFNKRQLGFVKDYI